MGSTTSQTPQPGAARARVVASFYGALLVGALLWHGIDQDSNDLWRLDPTQSLTTLLWTPLVMTALGVVAGVLPAVRAYSTDVAEHLVPMS